MQFLGWSENYIVYFQKFCYKWTKFVLEAGDNTAVVGFK